MCGICGFFQRDPGREVSRAILDGMTDAMVHRGPDDRGVFLAPGGGLGHRRLTILDLVGGQQPMATPDGRSVLVSNGEIYNYVELRDAHLSGVPMRSTGDTEVLLRLLDALGAAALQRLDGMFAFAFWDVPGRKLLLARDPAGQKPLFYHHGDDCFVFASELSSLARHPAVPREIDVEALAHYLLFEAFPHPLTPLRGVRKVEPGELLELDLRKWSLRSERYWDGLPRPEPAGRAAEARLLEEFEAEFAAAVDRHMRADVPIGIFLSAGLDSPSLVKAASAIRGGGELQTFTIRHAEASFDESGPAREVAAHYGTRHRERLLHEADFLSGARELLESADEPVADPGMLAIYQVIRFSREHVKVVLSGNGGDEFFAGYAPFRALAAQRVAGSLLPRPALAALRRLASLPRARHGYMNRWLQVQRFLRGVSSHPAELLMRWIGAFDHAEARLVMHPERAVRCLDERDPASGAPLLYSALHREFERVAEEDAITQQLHMFQRFFLPCCICNHSDKASMKVSQELRSPFLDTRVMRLANRLPAELKYRSGATKYLLRRYLEGDLPPSITARRKQGFTIPIASWLTSSLRSWADEVLDPEQIAADGFFDAARVRRLWEEHQSRRADHGKALWTILVFQVWLHGTFRSWGST